jgi:hypothetical protein
MEPGRGRGLVPRTGLLLFCRPIDWLEGAEQHPPNSCEVSLTLQHIGEFGEIGLESVLFRVLLSRKPKVINHRVDIVF